MFSSFLHQRMSKPRNRLYQLCVRSTTQRLGRCPRRRRIACCSSPRLRMCGMNPYCATNFRMPAESYPLSMHIPCRFRRGLGRFTGRSSNSSRFAPTKQTSCTLAASVNTDSGIPAASTRRLRFVPCFPRSVGFRPVFFPTQWCLGHRAVEAQERPVDAFRFVVAFQRAVEKFLEDTGLAPLLESVVRRRTGADARHVERLPLTSGAKDEQDTIQTIPVRPPWPTAAETMRVHPLGEKRLKEHPKLIRYRKPPISHHEPPSSGTTAKTSIGHSWVFRIGSKKWSAQRTLHR